MAVLGGRSRFSRAQKGSGSRTVYRRHRREEILIRPTVLDNAYRNSSSRVSSLSNDLGGRAVAFSLLLSPFPTRSISLRFAFLFPLSRLRSSFPSLIRPSSPSSPSSFHRQFLSGNEGTVLASIIPTSILPWPRWKNPASSLLVHEDEPFPSPLPLPPPLPRHLGSPLFRGDISFLLPLPPPTPSFPNRLLFDLFRNPFATRRPASLSFPLSRKKGPGTRRPEEPEERGSRFSVSVDQRVWRMERKSLDSRRIHTERESLESVHRSREMEFIAASYTLFSLSLFFFFFLLLSFRQYYLFLFRSFDFPFLFLCLCLCDVTDRNRRGTRRDGKGLAASRACDRSIRIRWVKGISQGQEYNIGISKNLFFLTSINYIIYILFLYF